MSLLTVALPAAQKVDSPEASMLVFGSLGLANLFSGDIPAARDAFARQLQLCLGNAFLYGADEGLIGLGAVAADEDRPEHAAHLLGAARALGYPPPCDQPIFDRLQARYFEPARTRYGTAAWDHAEQSGAKLSYEQAIDHALRHYPAHSQSATPTDADQADCAARHRPISERPTEPSTPAR